MTETEIITRFDSQNRVTSLMKAKEVLNNLGIKTEIYKRSSESTTEHGISKLHATRGALCILYKNLLF